MPKISLDKKVAEQLYELFHNVEVADSHYKRCQSDQFRMHVQSVYKNKGVSDAFEALQTAIDAAEVEPAPKKAAASPQEARKGVLGND